MFLPLCIAQPAFGNTEGHCIYFELSADVIRDSLTELGFDQFDAETLSADIVRMLANQIPGKSTELCDQYAKYRRNSKVICFVTDYSFWDNEWTDTIQQNYEDGVIDAFFYQNDAYNPLKYRNGEEGDAKFVKITHRTVSILGEMKLSISIFVGDDKNLTEGDSKDIIIGKFLE